MDQRWFECTVLDFLLCLRDRWYGECAHPPALEASASPELSARLDDFSRSFHSIRTTSKLTPPGRSLFSLTVLDQDASGCHTVCFDGYSRKASAEKGLVNE